MHKPDQIKLQFDRSQLPYSEYSGPIPKEAAQPTLTTKRPTTRFKHCRAVISINATHLYGKYKGKLMIAMATDANNKIYPLAFAVVESKSTKTWGWFLACRRRYVTNRRHLCVIFDRHPRIQAIFRDIN